LTKQAAVGNEKHLVSLWNQGPVCLTTPTCVHSKSFFSTLYGWHQTRFPVL